MILLWPLPISWMYGTCSRGGEIAVGIVINATASLTNLATTTMNVVGDQTWSVVPLSTWMGLGMSAGFAGRPAALDTGWISARPP